MSTESVGSNNRKLGNCDVSGMDWQPSDCDEDTAGHFPPTQTDSTPDPDILQESSGVMDSSSFVCCLCLFVTFGG